MVTLLEKAALPIVERNCALLALFDFLLFNLEHFDEIGVKLFCDGDSVSENVELVSFLQFSRSHFHSCDRNGFLFALLDSEDLSDLSIASLDTFDTVSLSFQCDFLNLFQESVNQVMSFWGDSIFYNEVIGLWGDSNSKTDNLCVGKFGILDVSRSGISDVSVEDVQVDFVGDLDLFSH